MDMDECLTREHEGDGERSSIENKKQALRR